MEWKKVRQSPIKVSGVALRF